MEEETMLRTRRLEDIPELIHHIQSLLPEKEGARTCVLSKSWLYAWSTNPIIMFHKTPSFASKGQLRNCNKWIDHTLERYSRDNIPMEKFDMFLTFENRQELTSLAEKWIRSLATQPCLKKIFLTIDVKLASFKLPDNILFGKNLNEMFIYSSGSLKNMVFMSTNHVIKCVSLRALTLTQVNISDEVLNNIFSICSLLEKIDLKYCKGFKTIKVKNLHYLCDFIIHQDREKDIFEIDDVPNLRLFDYSSTSRFERVPFNTDSLGSVTYLSVDGLIIEYR